RRSSHQARIPHTSNIRPARIRADSNFYATMGYSRYSEGANLQVTCTGRGSEPGRAPEGGLMRLVRPALALALASTALALATPSAGSAATLPTPTRIVLFTGR